MTKTFVSGTIAAVFIGALPGALLAQNKTPITCGQTYTVASGDSLSAISKRAYGSTIFDDLYNANRDVVGSNPNLIFVGQVLQVPCAAGETAIVAVAEPVAEPAPEVEVASAQSGPLVFTFNKTSAPKFIMNSGIIDIYLAEITEVTDGRVQFIDPPVMNRDPVVQLDLVTTGQVDGAYIFNGYLADSHPLLQLPMIPLMGGSAEQTAVSLWNLHENHLSKTDYFDEAKLLGFVAAPTAHIWRLSNEPVVVGQGIADMNNYAVPYFVGLDTRGPAAVREETEMQLMAQNEAENGTLTFFMAHGAARAVGVWKEDRTVTEVDNGLYTPTFSIVLSDEAWGQISPMDQQAIAAVSGEFLAHRSASWDAFDNGHRSHMLTTGLNTVKASDALLAELSQVSDTRVDNWIALADTLGIPGDQAVAEYKANLAALQDTLLFR
ncbi:LysM peptidoglycan-binding domain-containing protein [Yoonia sp. F2084L]|uniref:LysM peptidoglycan-binding domain-containing protein n=1 Tax=Yoonia sp. F2084L TaxID=2926419 RepID=UPI001FF4B4CD|nr:LysM peptidoglycan-binding domain-containing protein [Yoonia sp. F2084L]MCK0096485.1 LysM peptidoglycan-binding domain-containing protein [Yoonia sp. F2084L]